MRAFPMMRELGWPVVFDVTHSLQLPGAGDGVTAGQAEYIEPLASAGVAAGVDGVFLEVHERPDAGQERRAERLRLGSLLETRPAAAVADAHRCRHRTAEPSARPRVARGYRMTETEVIETLRRCMIAPILAMSHNHELAAGSLRRASMRARSHACSKPRPTAILGLVARLDERFERAVSLLCECHGRVVTTGMGKSGIICRKLAATLSSTGTPAFFLHPAEAIHGDLGVDSTRRRCHRTVVQRRDRGAAATARVHPTHRRTTDRHHGPRPAPRSGQAADVTLDCHVDEEACPMNLAPTASTTAALALGDALAMTLLVRKGFQGGGFANLHPGGKLGKRLMRAEALMHGGEAARRASSTTPMRDVIYEMTSKGLGMTCVVDGEEPSGRHHHRRRPAPAYERPPDVLDLSAADVMTPTPRTDCGLAARRRGAEDHGGSQDLVAHRRGRRDRRVRGVLHLHDLWRTEMF